MKNNKKNITEDNFKEKNISKEIITITRITDALFSNRIIFSEKHDLDTIPYTNYIDFGFGYGRKYFVRKNIEVDY